MIEKKFVVTLTNGEVQHKYYKVAFTEKQAVILAKAEAIELGRGFELVNVEVV